MTIKQNRILKHIDDLPESIKPIYKKLRALARRNMPGAHEMIYHNAVGYSLSLSPWDRVCYIAHQPKGYINFGFFFGIDLKDPAKLIQGSGKRIRHVKVYTLADAKNPALEQLIIDAWIKAEQDVSSWRESLKKRKDNNGAQ